MATSTIPVYDICSISKGAPGQDLLVERFGTYLEKHYHNLHRPHRHSFFHLVLFTKGKGSHTIDFVRYPLVPFQVYFMSPGQVHSWHFEGPTDGYIVHFNESLFTSFLQNSHYLERFPFFSGTADDAVCQLPLPQQPEAVRLFESMVAEAGESKEQNLDMIRLLLLQFFIRVDRACSRQQLRKVPPQKLVLLRNFQKLIDKYYRTIRLPREYAELLYITPNHLNALCQDLLGKTAGELIRDRIVLEARRLLTNAAMSSTEIAYELAFQDNSYFTRFFKKYTGTTPEEFRKSFNHQ
jgi:AraC family transcriptional regulator, transcriptional activator of pobA